MESINHKEELPYRINLQRDVDPNLSNIIISTISSMEDDNYILENSDWSNYEIIDWIKRFITPKIIKFDKDRTIHFVDKEVFLVIYKDKSKREIDKWLHEKNNIDFFDYQSPQVIWSVDSEKKYYLILKTKKSPNWDTNEKTYRWIILNPTIWVKNIEDLYAGQIEDILSK